MKKKSNDFSIIDKGLVVEGEIFCQGELIIKGTLKGKLSADRVVIAKDGAVYAEVRANYISIAGVYEGVIISAREIVILSSGKCTGQVNCRQMVLEPGGLLNAEVICSPEFVAEN